MPKQEITKLSRASHRMMHAACLQAEIEAMKAENREAEWNGQPPVHGYRQFMNAIERWHYDG